MNSSYKFKVLRDFGSNYSKSRTTKEHRQDPENNRKSGIQQENNDIVQHAVDDIILQQNKKLSVKNETHDNINYEVDDEELYNIDKMSVDQK